MGAHWSVRLVIAMPRCASGSALGTQFDDFLFASVRDDRNGPLSVLSALARLDVDPWRMAATLAKLPRTAAAQSLASLFADLPDGPGDREAVATHLVTFLPDQASSQAGTIRAANLMGGEAHTQSPNFVVIYIIAMLAGLLVNGLVQSHQPSQPSAAPAAAVGKAPASSMQASADH